jgi:hypothetical protein
MQASTKTRGTLQGGPCSQNIQLSLTQATSSFLALPPLPSALPSRARTLLMAPTAAQRREQARAASPQQPRTRYKRWNRAPRRHQTGLILYHHLPLASRCPTAPAAPTSILDVERRAVKACWLFAAFGQDRTLGAPEQCRRVAAGRGERRVRRRGARPYGTRSRAAMLI